MKLSMRLSMKLLRVRALGSKTRATLKEFINSSQIQDLGAFPNADTMLSNLLTDHETIIKHLGKTLRNVKN
jgi:DNA-binding ferritin-like protein